jgi:hypothetical protein
MAKRTGTVADSLLDPTRANDPQVLGAYDQVKKEQRKRPNQAELFRLRGNLNAIEAELRSTPPAAKVRVNFLKRRKREAEGAIKTWQYLNGFR